MPRGPLQYPATPAGKKVQLSKGVTATVVTAKNSVRVVWRYPTRGVPRYLQGVATVTVTGTGLPAATVVAVARHVEPNSPRPRGPPGNRPSRHNPAGSASAGGRRRPGLPYDDIVWTSQNRTVNYLRVAGEFTSLEQSAVAA